MEQWRSISRAGVLLGTAASIMDALASRIPYVLTIPIGVMIPIEAVSLTLIFSGLIMRKRQRARGE